jgi:polyisoprenoid-binding protein YceI
LKSDKYKNISYKLTSATLLDENGGYLLKSIGTLTIAGVTKDITMDVHCLINGNGTITCNGTYKLNMSDYNVDPPSFMWGAMKTGNEIALDYSVVYLKQKGA